MKNRQQNIIYQLAVSDRPLTADELAKKLGVSSRTIKSEMPQIRRELQSLGATLRAKRNEGYSLTVEEPEIFTPFFDQLSIHSIIVNNFASDDIACFLYIARKLVSSSRYVKIDDLADELYTSRSSLRLPIKRVLDFFRSYHLEAESRPGLGLRVFGAEHHLRLAMMELFAFHFHKVILDNAGIEYAKWIACDFQERQDIRHCFLKTLRESGLQILDVDTQRLSIYLLIARNRRNAGYRLRLPEAFVEEIRQYEEYGTASSIFSELSAQFDGYDVPEQETAFLAIYLLCCRDMTHIPSLQPGKFPTLYDNACAMEAELSQCLRKLYGLDLHRFPWMKDQLGATLIPVLAGLRFSCNGMENFWYSSANQMLQSPLAADMGKVLFLHLEALTGESLSLNVLSKFCCLLFKAVSQVSYDIRKRKLILLNSDGVFMDSVLEERLMKRYSNLIESCVHAEMYEVRGMDETQYDAIVMDIGDMTYNYTLPYGTLHTLPYSREMDAVYNELLIHAYQYKDLLPASSSIRVYDSFSYVDEEQFFQFISLKNCHEPGKARQMEDYLTKKETLLSCRCPASAAIVFGERSLADEDAVELYCLEHPGSWAGEEISYILYVCLDYGGSWRKVKAMENALTQLSSDVRFFQEFQENKDGILGKMICQYLKYE